MIDELTSELLDLTVTVQGRTAGAFAMLAVCCWIRANSQSVRPSARWRGCPVTTLRGPV